MQDMTWCFPLRSPGHCAKIPVLPEEMGNVYDYYFAPVVLLLCRLEVSQGFPLLAFPVQVQGQSLQHIQDSISSLIDTIHEISKATARHQKY